MVPFLLAALLLAGPADARPKKSVPAPTPAAAAPAPDAPLIPLEALFGNPERSRARLSPDGTTLAWLADRDGVLNVWTQSLAGGEPRPLTADTGRGIRQYHWAPGGKQILYLVDAGGNENWQLHAVPAAGGAPVDLSRAPAATTEILALEPSKPGVVLVTMNERDPQVMDVHRVDLTTGRREMVYQNDIGAIGFVADHDLVVRAAQVPTPDGGFQLLARKDAKSKWEVVTTWGMLDAMQSAALAFSADNKQLLVSTSAGSDTAELRAWDLATRTETTLARDPTADFDDLLFHPTTHVVQAVGFQKARLSWTVLDPAIQKDVDAISRLSPGDWSVVDRDEADRRWLVFFDNDKGSPKVWSWDRTTQTGTLLFATQPSLDRLPLVEMKPVSWKARDGLTIHGYLTLPKGASGRLPAVILVHGGPWSRDTWGFDPTAQWLADRGYAVLQPNFRGSTGYGKAFLNAGDKEWGGKMQDDISDGVKMLVEQGVADPAKVAIMGGSYGGYATLAGLAYTPELYACGVDIVGPSNLLSFMDTIPPYWGPMIPILHQRVGNPTTEAGLLRSRSPLFAVDKMVDPLLIAQGANDPRVNKVESRQIVAAMKSAGRSVRYVEFAEEGHGFAKPANRLYFYREAERFLGACLGGRVAEDARNPTVPPQVTVE